MVLPDFDPSGIDPSIPPFLLGLEYFYLSSIHSYEELPYYFCDLPSLREALRLPPQPLGPLPAYLAEADQDTDSSYEATETDDSGSESDGAVSPEEESE